MSEDDDRSSPSDSVNTIDSCSNKTTSGSTSGSGPSSIPEYQAPYPDQVLENVLENVLCFLTSRRDRNAASLVCRSWYRVEALTRSDLFIGNCYAVSPRRATSRFTRIRSVTLKGKPRFADFNLMPPNWGPTSRPGFLPWLRRTRGSRRQLRVLDLIESEVSDDEVDWISFFPESATCLESLIFDCVDCPINFDALERLVARSLSLKKLRLNRYVSIGQLHRLMVRAPQLTHLGTGSFRPSEDVAQGEQEPDYTSAFAASKSLVCLSGFRDIIPDYLTAIYPVCASLTSLNLSYANINAEQLKPIIGNCHKLQIFWVLDSICDEGLQAVAATCKELRELRVFPIDAREDSEGPVSEVGLQAISEGCRKLQSILYFCQRMTNAAVIAMSKNCPDLVVFRLCIMGRHRPDHVTGEPMDEGFGAIVMNCKKLTRLAVSGLLTDRAFNYFGRYGKQ
ncbi:hypothetical protein GH714_003031 [Hevea brasiliensis]|uniref:F-box domain-containing protein n=1 Tax=Hevea brasiliensis TaxID=3981 RepID=A0A6A6LHG6_HEVBR|nr:hypothetical protein GH714_003031 [Hevea brasiliensis]